MVDELGDKSRLYRTSSKRLSTPLIVTILLLLLVLLGGGYVYFQSQQQGKKVATAQLSPTPTFVPTNTPTPTQEATPSGSPTLTPSTSPKPTAKPTGVLGTSDRSSITVTVLNGSGTAGLASKVGNYLTGLGYNVSSTGNADAFDYEGITIHVKKSKSDILAQLKKDLSSQGTVTDTTTTYTGSGDAEVIIGK